MKLSDMTREERSLLLYLETCCVDWGGSVEMVRINDEDLVIVDDWKKSRFIEFGRIYSKNVMKQSGKGGRKITHWVQLSDEAWKLAHEERRRRAERTHEKRWWRKTTEI